MVGTICLVLGVVDDVIKFRLLCFANSDEPKVGLWVSVSSQDNVVVGVADCDIFVGEDDVVACIC